MYSYIKGALANIATDHIILDNNGIGYKIYVPYNNSKAFPEVGEEITVYTYLNVTENAMTMYGFFDTEDRDMFLRLIGVSGIGPKAGISILSTLSARDIMLAILNNDDTAISAAPGVGSKTAQRLIVDLKDKLNISEDILLNLNIERDYASVDTNPGEINDTILALSALGYPYNEAKRAVLGIKGAENMLAAELLSLALKEL